MSAALVVTPVLTSPAQAADAGGRTAILVLDTSGSMEGDRISAARDAGVALVEALPDDVAVGLVTFGDDRVRVNAEPVLDHARVVAEIEQLEAAGGTAMYDGIVAAAKLAAGGRVIVLTDGDDTASAATAKEAGRALAAAGTPADIIAIQLQPELRERLAGLAAGSGGSLVRASGATALAAAFEKAAQPFSAAPSPTPHLSSKPAPAAAPPVVTAQESSAGAIRLAAFVFLMVIAIAILMTMAWRREAVARRTRDVVHAYARPTMDPRSRELLPAVKEASSTRLPRTAARLERAGMTLTPERWITALGAAGIIAFLLALAFTGSVVIAAFIAIGAVPLTGRAYLGRRAKRRQRSFEEELPSFLQVLASGLRAGLSFGQALDTAAGDGTTELSRQMRRALGEVQMGATVDSALMRVAERVDSDDLRWTVSALAIQREVGGNLSRILETASITVKGRAEIGREVRTLSAEGRLSAAILVALPIGMFGFLALTRPEYVEIFWTTGTGMVMLVAIALLITGGWLWMRRLVRIEV